WGKYSPRRGLRSPGPFVSGKQAAGTRGAIMRGRGGRDEPRGLDRMSTKGQMRLGAFFNPTGHHVASWRHPDAQADAGINFKHYVEITQTPERAKFDLVFLADNVCVRHARMEAVSPSAQS